MSDKIPVLFDTDIGSDIDDAIALAYLLRQPRCELLGITTVTGDVQKRAALAEEVCRTAGKDHIEIHCGRRDPLFNGNGQPEVPQYRAISQKNYPLKREENTAVEFLRKTIRKHPHEITLLTVGPYSNIALLFALDPEIPFLVKQIVSMAGIFFAGDHREWNCLCDPTANAMVYKAPRHNHVSVGLDVTTKCTMSAAEVKAHFVGDPLSTVLKMAEAWFEGTNLVTFHDPLAAVGIFHPDLMTYKHGHVTTSPDPAKEQLGYSVLVEGEGPDDVAATVDSKRFFQEYFSVFH